MVDFHIHSNYSDGSLSPLEIFKKAQENKLIAISITDHDNIDNSIESIRYSEQFNIKYFSGIEVSTTIAGISDDIHIVGLGMNLSNHDFLALLGKMQHYRKERNEEYIRNFKKHGIEIQIDELLRNKTISSIGKPDFALYFYRKKIVTNPFKAYDELLNDNSKYYSKRITPDYTTIIETIRNSNGIAILAHPHQLKLEINILDRITKSLVDVGLNGIETYYTGYKKKYIKQIKQIAKRYGLFQSGGSDFHCYESRNAEIGKYGKNKYIPLNVFENLLFYISGS